MRRCQWAKDQLLAEYHDKEWGVPQHDDTKLFELLILQGAQAGLSWSTILKRRESYRKAFDNFDATKIAKYTKQDIKRLLANQGIIRNKLKIESAINNASRFLEIQKEFGSFDRYLWGFVDGKPVQNKFKKLSDIPASTTLSDKISKDLKKRGFNFIGTTICYAYMQAIGMTNDHTTDCFRYSELQS
ncbi:MAG: DNA-3-methyladenine glycosylase I [Nitrososphaera sp.]|jgi:DNA-3-methyladenine glycosylase I